MIDGSIKKQMSSINFYLHPVSFTNDCAGKSQTSPYSLSLDKSI